MLSDAISLFPDKIDTDRIIRAIFEDPRVDRIVATNAVKYGVLGDKPELKQSLAIIFFEKYLLREGALSLETSNDVYSLTYKIAENLARTQSRQFGKGNIELDDHGLSDESDSFRENMLLALDHCEELVDSGFEDRCIAKVDQALAQQEFADLMQQQGHSMTSTIPGVRIAGTLKVKTKTKRESLGKAAFVSDDHKELRAIREKLGISLGDMRKQLMIPLSTLQSYVYGKTDTVPADVMERARALLKDERNVWRMNLIQKFDRPINEILAEWQAKLGSDGDDFVRDIARFALVNPITVLRWIKNENRPGVDVLEACDRAIELEMQRRNQK